MATGNYKRKSSKIMLHFITFLYASIAGVLRVSFLSVFLLSISTSPATAAPGTGIWAPETVDNTGDVGWDTSVAVDSTGRVHISYCDAGNGDLKHAINDSGIWVIETVDNGGVDGAGNVGWYTSIAIDSVDKTHIGYFDVNNGDLLYVTSNASGGWEAPVIVDGVTGHRGKHLSLALDQTDKVHISYYDTDNGDLMYATNASGQWVPETVANGGDVGWDTSIAVDSTGKVHISYYDAVNRGLKYVTTNASGEWAPETVVSGGGVGWDTSIALDSASNIHISYYDFANEDLKYAVKTSGSINWSTEPLDSDGNVGAFTSLFVDMSGTEHIGYYDYTNESMKYATNATGAWALETVDSGGDVGQYGSITVDLLGNVHMGYYDFTNRDLKYAIKRVPYTLKKGFNLISAPTNMRPILTAHTFLGLTDINGRSVERALRYDSINGIVQEAFQNPDGSIGGTDFAMVPGEGIIVYAPADMEIEVQQNTCSVFNLKAGANWVGTPCRTNNASAFPLLQAINADNAISIQRFNPDTGRLETAGYLNGRVVGVDFPIEPRKGYIINMKTNVPGYTP